MPTRVCIERRTIYLNAAMESIITMYDKALQKQGIPIEQDKKQQNRVSDHAVTVAPVAEMKAYKRSGILPTAIRAFEQASGEPYGGYYYELPEQYIELDSEAAALYKEYNSFLIKALTKENVSSESTECQEVSSRFALTYILLSRLAGYALQCKTDSLNNATSIIQALEDFQEQLIASTLLNSTRIEGINATFTQISSLNIPSTLTDRFITEISKTRASWNTRIKQIIHSIQLLHSHTTSISEGNYLLERTRCAISRQLLACIAPTTKESDYNDQWYEQILLKRLDNLQAKVQTNEINLQSTRWYYDQLSLQQGQQLAILMSKRFDRIVIDKIKQLFRLLNTTEILINIFRCIDDLFRIFNWLPILNGSINMQALESLLMSFSEIVKNSLNIDDELLEIIGSDANRHLRKHHADNGDNLAIELDSLRYLIHSLGGCHIKTIVTQSMCTTIKSMQEIDQSLPLAFRFIRNQGNAMATTHVSTQRSHSPRVVEIEDNNADDIIQTRFTPSSIASSLYHRFIAAPSQPIEQTPLLPTVAEHPIELQENVATPPRELLVPSPLSEDHIELQMRNLVPQGQPEHEFSSSWVQLLNQLIKLHNETTDRHLMFKKFWQVLYYTESGFFYSMDRILRTYYKQLEQERKDTRAMYWANNIQKTLANPQNTASARRWATANMSVLFNCNEIQLQAKIETLKSAKETSHAAVIRYQKNQLHLTATTHRGWSKQHHEFLDSFLYNTPGMGLNKEKITQFLSNIIDQLAQNTQETSDRDLTVLLEKTLTGYISSQGDVAHLTVVIRGLIRLGADPRQWMRNNPMSHENKQAHMPHYIIAKEAYTMLSRYQHKAEFLDDTLLSLGKTFNRLVNEMDIFGRKLYDCVDSDNGRFWTSDLGKRLYKDGARVERSALFLALLDWIHLIFNDPLVMKHDDTQAFELNTSITTAKDNINRCKIEYDQAIKRTTQFPFLYNFGQGQCERLMDVVKEIHLSLVHLGACRVGNAKHSVEAQAQSEQDHSLRQAAEGKAAAAHKQAAADRAAKETLHTALIASMKAAMPALVGQSIPSGNQYDVFKSWIESQLTRLVAIFPTLGKKMIQDELFKLLAKDETYAHLADAARQYHQELLPTISISASRDTLFSGSTTATPLSAVDHDNQYSL